MKQEVCALVAVSAEHLHEGMFALSHACLSFGRGCGAAPPADTCSVAAYRSWAVRYWIGHITGLAY